MDVDEDEGQALQHSNLELESNARDMNINNRFLVFTPKHRLSEADGNIRHGKTQITIRYTRSAYFGK